MPFGSDPSGWWGELMGSGYRTGGRSGGGGGVSNVYYDPKHGFVNPELEGAKIGADTQRYAAGLQAGTAANELAFKRERFNRVFGELGGLANNLGGPFTAGGSSGAGPEIGVRGVYDPRQIDQQVAAMRAHNDAATQARFRQFEQDAAGRGYAPGSPLLMAMQGRLQSQNLANSADQERGIRFQAAGANADQILKAQQARESQYASRQAEDIERRKPYFQQQNALIAALAGLA